MAHRYRAFRSRLNGIGQVTAEKAYSVRAFIVYCMLPGKELKYYCPMQGKLSEMKSTITEEEVHHMNEKKSIQRAIIKRKGESQSSRYVSLIIRIVQELEATESGDVEKYLGDKYMELDKKTKLEEDEIMIRNLFADAQKRGKLIHTAIQLFNKQDLEKEYWNLIADWKPKKK